MYDGLLNTRNFSIVHSMGNSAAQYSANINSHPRYYGFVASLISMKNMT